MCSRLENRLSLQEVPAVTGSRDFSPVWGVPGRFGAVRDEGKLSLKGGREMCPGAIQEITPKRPRDHGMVWVEGTLKIL